MAGNRSLGSLTVDLILRSQGWAEGWTKAERDANAAQREMQKKARETAKAIDESFSAMKVAGVAAAAGIGLAVTQTVRAANELVNVAAIANSSTQEFQKMAIAADTVGISQEKLGDQLKDFNEKVGEFLDSGGGGMKDFFENIAPKIGITKDAFRDLSGTEGLQLYYDSLEKAGLSQKQMSFYLESMASDTTALIPVLANGGKAIKDLGDIAERSGAIMNDKTLRAAQEMSLQVKVLQLQTQGLVTQMSASLLPTLADLAGEFTTVGVEGSVASGVGELMSATLRGLAVTAMGAYGAVRLLGTAIGGVAGLVNGSDLEFGSLEDMYNPQAAWGKLKRNFDRFSDPQLIEGFKDLGRDLDTQANQIADSINNIWAAGSDESKASNVVTQIVEQREALRKAMQGAGGANIVSPAEAKKATDEAQKYLQALRDQYAAVKDMSVAQQLDYDIQQGKVKLTATQLAQAREYAELLDQRVAREKAAAEFAKEVARVNDELNQNEKLREEIALIGLEEEQVEALNRQRVEAALLIKEQHAAELDRLSTSDAGWTRERANLQSEIDLLRERLELLDTRRSRTKVAEAWRQQKEAGEKAMDSIVNAFTDGLINGTQSFSQLLKNTVFTVLVRPAVSGVIGSMLGVQGSGGSGNGLGFDFNGLGGSIGDFLSDAGFNAISNGFGSVGQSLHNLGSTIKGVDSWLKDLPGMKGGLSSALGYGSALMNLANGNYGTGLGEAIGTLIMPGLGTMVGGMLGGLVDKLFGSNPKEHSGGVYSSSLSRDEALDSLGLTKHARGDFTKRQNEAVDDALSMALGGILDIYEAFEGRVSGTLRKLDINAAFATNPISTDEDAYGYFNILDRLTGEQLLRFESRDGGVLGNDPAAAFSKFTGEIAGVLISELKEAGLPAWMENLFDGLGDDITLEGFQAVLIEIAKVDAGFAALGNVMGMFADASDDLKSGMLAVLGTIDNITAAANTFYGAFYSEQERMQAAAANMNAALAGLNIFDDRGGIDVLGPDAKARFRLAIEELMAAGNGELAAILLNMSGAFAQIADYGVKAAEDAARAMEEARQNAIDAAWANFEAATDRERTYWESIRDAAADAIAKLQPLIDSLKLNASELFAIATGSSGQQMQNGLQYIADTLAAVRSGASLSSFTGIDNAIADARAGMTTDNYGSEFEYLRAVVGFANDLSALAGLGDDQLSVEERILKAAQAELERIDELVTLAEKLNGSVIDFTLSQREAFERLFMLIDPEASSPPASGGGGGGGGGGGASFGPGSGATTSSPYGKTDARLTRALNGDASAYAEIAAIKQAMHAFDGTGDLAGLMSATIAAGGTALDVSREYGYDLKQLEEVLKAAGVPAYRQGTPYVPEDGYAMLHKGEAVIPEQYNPFAGDTAQAPSAALAIAQQTLEVQRAILSRVASMNNTMNNWDGDGIPETREVERV
jgi:hypothetical protein